MVQLSIGHVKRRVINRSTTAQVRATGGTSTTNMNANAALLSRCAGFDEDVLFDAIDTKRSFLIALKDITVEHDDQRDQPRSGRKARTKLRKLSMSMGRAASSKSRSIAESKISLQNVLHAKGMRGWVTVYKSSTNVPVGAILLTMRVIE